MSQILVTLVSALSFAKRCMYGAPDDKAVKKQEQLFWFIMFLDRSCFKSQNNFNKKYVYKNIEIYSTNKYTTILNN